MTKQRLYWYLSTNAQFPFFFCYLEYEKKDSRQVSIFDNDKFY